MQRQVPWIIAVGVKRSVCTVRSAVFAAQTAASVVTCEVVAAMTSHITATTSDIAVESSVIAMKRSVLTATTAVITV